MSGDVQPRKRKDKKRRKDEGEQIPTQTHAPLPTITPNDDLNIHVHKEGGTGGGICAKLVFFVLLSAIAVLIGMIITEYRGQTDVDTADTESRFSQIFEGWTDSAPDNHDEHDLEALDDFDHDEENDHNVSEAEDDEEEEHEPSEEDDEEEEEINDDNEESEEENAYAEEDQDEDEDQEEPALEDSEENQLDQDEDDDDEVQDSDEEGQDTYEKSDEKDDDVEDDEDEQDHEDDEQELQNIDSEEKDRDDDEDHDELADEEDEISSEKKSNEQDDNAMDEDEAGENEDKVLVPSKKIKVKDVDDEQPSDEKQQESSVAVKLGVGVALLVVAHLVLVRKWRTAPDDKPITEEVKEATPDLSRRNTIVVPPTFQEVEQDIEQDEEDYSDEELSEEEEIRDEPKSAKTKYQELRSTYTRSLTPEGEIDYHKPSETYDDEYEDNVEDEEDEEVSEEEEEEEEEEEGESDNEDYDDDEDEELLKRLEAKYGKLHGDKNKGAVAQDEDSDSDKLSDDATGYEYSNITNKEDLKVKDELDKAQKAVQNNSAYAIKLFDKILQNYPSSPRSIYGKALALDYLAEQKRSNAILEQALKFYTKLFNTENVPHALFEMAAERCVNRMRFVGQYRNVINVHKQLIERFPHKPKHSNDLAVTYLTINRVEAARSVFKEVLRKWPQNGFALVHLGFILKTSDNKLQEAVVYLKKGLETKDEGVEDGRFYFHLGDALTRLGLTKDAMEVYEEGVKNKVFLSKYQRSLYNVPNLTGKPWWKLEELPYMDLVRLLKQNWRKIKEEGLAVLNEKGYFQDESENLRDSGEWKQFELFARGQKNTQNCKKCPFTCSIIEKIPEARGCKRGQTKFSVMHPGTHVWPHCGPTNCRLRTHLGLKVPPKTFIRVAEDIRSWKEGEVFVFDDSFEHEVWHNGTDFRLVLIIDVWHPELTPIEKRNLSPI